jgi:hypothetical protein
VVGDYQPSKLLVAAAYPVSSPSISGFRDGMGTLHELRPIYPHTFFAKIFQVPAPSHASTRAIGFCVEKTNYRG